MVEEKIMDVLLRNGYEAFIVGGAVRDRLLDKEALDKDIVTNASVEEMEEMFSLEFQQIDFVGKRFGVLIVEGVEVAQYRSEVYEEVSKPKVQLVKSLVEDSKRRDFTVNAMYEDVEGYIEDPQGGLEDIERKVIRSVGKAEERFREDPSRILRALYLEGKLDFRIEKETEMAMVGCKEWLNEVPNELKGKMLDKAEGNGGLGLFLDRVRQLGMVEYIFSDWEEEKKMEEWTVESDDKEVVLAGFLRGQGRNVVEKDLQELGLGKKVAKRVALLVDALQGSQEKMGSREWLLRVAMNVEGREELESFVNQFGLITNGTEWDGEDVNRLLAEGVFFVSELPVNGKDLMEKGIQGREIGMVLNQMVEANVKRLEDVEKFRRGDE